MPCAIGFDKGIDYISHRYALQQVLIRELIIFLIVIPISKPIQGITMRNIINSLIKTHRKAL